MKRVNATVSYRGTEVVSVNVPDNFSERDIEEAALMDINIPMDAEIYDVLDWEVDE